VIQYRLKTVRNKLTPLSACWHSI